MTKILIIGAGHAGGSVAAFLRQYGHEGPIVLVGEEDAPPYQRPPLSKAWLKGEADLEALLLRPLSFYEEQGIDFRPSTVAVSVDPEAKTVAFHDGSSEPYDVLVLATGSTARKLPVPGGDHPDLLELRTLKDAERLKAALGPGKRLAVVGGGYVGLEAAASARALGAEAVVIERAPRVLARVASETLSAFFTAQHRAHGVEILTGAEVVAVAHDGVTLADGSVVQADAVLVGVGALACESLARSAGLRCDDGVVVDEQARTSDPAIFAVGDMTRRPIPVHGGVSHRLESVPNALEQAKQAAAAIVGRPGPAPEVPWFWSDQYDFKLQIAGLPFDADRQVVRGDPSAGGFAVFHLNGDRVVCVEAVNAPPEFMAGKQLIGKGTPVDVAKLADQAVSMKAVGV
ncbi:MAG: FAD-dependent oxidoreductase [Alphaproteobacteria bacterium]|uniref:NAD(P)/FAD-dependent oxidoreductase n=1 Tax=Brevundimonas sp. TaxID=1871086 RepID=UPI001E06B125|nr:FAD-dependent oxidoreductase [Alphaproteobacteria bacterium]MBU1520193.1 FAD-dependent oxidoreductase [Alphaproteobacteria bacterium]MBU2029211.1 FAD-dependent oxidoreductase [Alphaproteobacteria bacterium]MBU2165273.1 FAD-dependent oxidoreductase [Alphaproteobacteria bacterium]MBU2231496.1 FAD-dependent oxidoreductase [Alphaproteobacteria bacterium]